MKQRKNPKKTESAHDQPETQEGSAKNESSPLGPSDLMNFRCSRCKSWTMSITVVLNPDFVPEERTGKRNTEAICTKCKAAKDVVLKTYVQTEII